MENGKNIKKIRSNKGYTQKYVATNIISQASFSKFEAGHSDIHSCSFIQVLNRLDMTLEEAQYISNDYTFERTQELINRFFALPYNDICLLNKLLSEINVQLETNNSILLGDISLICEALISLQTNSDIDLARKMVEPVWNRLAKHNQWYLIDIRLLNTILYLFPNDTALEVTKNILSRLEQYRGFQDTLRLSITFRVNLSLLLIKEKDYGKALKLLKETLEQHKKAMPYQSLAICLGRLAICNSKLGKKNAHTFMEQAEKVLMVYEEIDLWKKVQAEYRYYIEY